MVTDRHALYEASVQGVEFDLDFAASVFRRLRGRPARVLREDFCGTAALSGGWVLRSPSNVAYGIDLDPVPLAWASKHRLSRLNGASRVHLLRADVLHARVPPADLTLASTSRSSCSRLGLCFCNISAPRAGAFGTTGC